MTATKKTTRSQSREVKTREMVMVRGGAQAEVGQGMRIL
jgi:hypothetical protein